MNTIKHWSIIILSTLFSQVAIADHSEHAMVEFLNTKPSNAALPFSEAVRVGNTLFLSGKLGINPKTGKLAEGGVTAEAEQILLNIAYSLKKYGYSMSDVVKCTVMLTNITDFKAFNEVYSKHFTPPYPARSAFAVSALALNSTVEVECIAAN